MGSLVKGISQAVSSIGNALPGPLDGLVKGIGDFAQSPLGQLAITSGLAFLTGGSSLLAGGSLTGMLGSGGLSAGLSSLFGSGGAGNLISSLAQNFLGDAPSSLSQGGLSSLLALTQGQGSGGLMQILSSLFTAQAGRPQSEDALLGQQINLQQLMAWRQAQQHV